MEKVIYWWCWGLIGSFAALCITLLCLYFRRWKEVCGFWLCANVLAYFLYEMASIPYLGKNPIRVDLLYFYPLIGAAILLFVLRLLISIVVARRRAKDAQSR